MDARVVSRRSSNHFILGDYLKKSVPLFPKAGIFCLCCFYLIIADHHIMAFRSSMAWRFRPLSARQTPQPTRGVMLNKQQHVRSISRGSTCRKRCLPISGAAQVLQSTSLRAASTANPSWASNGTAVFQRNVTTDSSGSRRTTPGRSQLARVYLAVGSNLGHRFQNIDSAIAMLSKTEDSASGEAAATVINLVHTSMLHETAPMYVTDQPSFLNGVVEIETNLSPMDLLRRIKQVEAQMGRDLEGGIRNGPRPVDLDILLYLEKKTLGTAKEEYNNHQQETSLVMDTPDLIIPHPRMTERDFVMAPLCEVAGLNHPATKGTGLSHPVLMQSLQQLYQILQHKEQAKEKSMSEDAPQRVVVLPLLRDRMLYLNETVIMGILNVTPDSFSDGGKWNASLDVACQRALEMEREGASIIDIGGESTRPGAKEVAIDEEIKRTIPVIERIRQSSDIPISIDTRHAAVAKAAIDSGADIVNDVSGGMFDPDMLPTVAALRVPIVLMHMKGTPETMQTYASDYSNVVDDVTDALLKRCAAAEAAGIPRWMQIVDPGIGFAKDMEGNLSLLRHLNDLRANMGMASTPILLGTSRKGFIGKLTGADNAEDRDFGSLASCVAAMCLGTGISSNRDGLSEACNILRVHNVKAMKDAATVMDAIRRA